MSALMFPLHLILAVVAIIVIPLMAVALFWLSPEVR